MSEQPSAVRFYFKGSDPRMSSESFVDLPLLIHWLKYSDLLGNLGSLVHLIHAT